MTPGFNCNRIVYFMHHISKTIACFGYYINSSCLNLKPSNLPLQNVVTLLQQVSSNCRPCLSLDDDKGI